MPINRKVMIRPLVLTGDKLKIGLDSSVLLDLILNVESKLYFHNKISLFRKKGTFFTHINCYNESINTLIKKYNYTNEKAKEEVDDLIKEYNISKIHITEKILELADHILGMCKDKGLHETDSIILAGFKTYKIDIAYSGNNHFVDSCNFIGIRGRKFPSIDKIIDKKFKFFRY